MNEFIGIIEKLPSQELARSNIIYLNTSPLDNSYITIKNDYYLAKKLPNDINISSKETIICLPGPTREKINVTIGQTLQYSWKKSGVINKQSKLEFIVKGSKNINELPSNKTVEIALRQILPGLPLYRGAQFYVLIGDKGLLILQVGCNVENSPCSLKNSDDCQIRIIGKFQIWNKKTILGLSGDTADAGPLFKEAIDMKSLGIGGLTSQFHKILRTAFTNRLLGQEVADSYCVKAVKGVLLHGPPGTGKTMIVRKLCSIMQNTVMHFVSGPDLLNKYVGESEAALRQVFSPAETEWKKVGKSSKLHVIVMDEFDALFKQRGGNSTSGVNDNMVNQLLTKMDGIDTPENFIIFGLTNRLDMIDDAVKRAGRFSLHVEIPLPTKSGRREIFDVYLDRLAKSGRLEKVDINRLVDITPNRSGADIENIVNTATSYALTESVDKALRGEDVTVDFVKVSMIDLERSIEECHTIQPGDAHLLQFYADQDRSVYQQTTKFIEDVMVSPIPIKGKFVLLNTNLAGIQALVSWWQLDYVKLIRLVDYIHLSTSEIVKLIISTARECIKFSNSVMILDSLDIMTTLCEKDERTLKNLPLAITSALEFSHLVILATISDRSKIQSIYGDNNLLHLELPKIKS